MYQFIPLVQIYIYIFEYICLFWLSKTKTGSQIYMKLEPQQPTLFTPAMAGSSSRISLLKRQLHTLQQGSKNCTDYLHQAKLWADQLSAMGKTVDDEDLISFVINGLNPTYNSFITAFYFAVRDREMSFADFQAELLSHEILLESQQHQTISPFTNKAPCHGSVNRRAKFPSNPKQNFKRLSPSLENFSSPNHFTKPQPNASPCQICGKSNHWALDCYHRMDYSYQGRHPPSQLAAMVAQTNAEFENQDYANSGANAHITAPQPFEGNDGVGVGMILVCPSKHRFLCFPY